jgi:hypothetical protein
MMIMMMPGMQPMGHPGMAAMQLAMPPHMMGSPTAQQMGQKVGPNVVMMPMPAMPQVAPAGMMRPVDPAMVPETVGPTVVSMPQMMDPNQCAGRVSGDRFYDARTAYPANQQFFQPSPESSSSFREVCSPNYQSSEAYERYVKDIMNAEGDDFQFDWPRRGYTGHAQGNAEPMMADKTRLPESEVSTDEGAWSYASEPSNSGRWLNSSSLVLSP